MALPVVVHPPCLRRKTARVRTSFEPPCPGGLTEWEIRNHRLVDNHVFLFLGFSSIMYRAYKFTRHIIFYHMDSGENLSYEITNWIIVLLDFLNHRNAAQIKVNY